MRLVKGLGYTVIGLLALTVVVGGGLIVYLQHADLGPLAIKLAKQYGHVDVAAQGPVSVKLFPNPEIHAGKLTVVGPQGGKPLFEADKTDIVMRWGSVPMLWKGMVLENVSLQNPTIYLYKPKKGAANWEMPGSEAEGAKVAAKSSGRDGSFKMALGQANISNLNATYIDETTGRNVNVRGLNVQTDAHDLAHTTLAMKGTINNQPLESKVEVDATNLDKAPIKVALTLANLRLNAQGEIDNRQSYRGDINVQSPDVRATYVAALGTAPAGVPSAPLSLTGHVALGGDEIDLSAFALKMGDLLNAGGELAVKTGDKPSAKGTLQVQGNNLRALAALGTGTSNPSIPASPFSLQTTLAGDNVIKLTNISAQLTNIASLGGNVIVTPRPGKTPKMEGQVNVRAASARALGQAFGVSHELPAQPLAMGTSFKGGDDWNIPDLSLSLGNLLSANVKATVTLGGPVPLVNGSLDVSGNDMKAAASGFGVASTQLPSSRFTVKADIAGDKTIELRNLSVNLPNLVEATGMAQMTPPSGNAPGDVKANLNVKRLDLTALGPCAPTAASAATKAAAAQGGGAAGTGSPFNSTPIDLGALKKWTFTFDVDVANLSCARWPITTFKGNMVNTAGKLSLNNMSAALAGGNALVNGSLTHTGTPELSLVVTVKNVPVEKFVPTLQQKGVVLPVNVDANITSTGASSQALASALKGTLAVNATSGKIPYTNLLGGMSNIERLLNGNAPASNGEGKIQKFVASYDIAGGNAKTKEFNLVTDGAFSAVGTGDINIGAWSIDYTLTPQVAASNQIAVPVLIKGSLSAPSIGPDPAFINKLSGRLVKEGLKVLNVGGEKAGNIGTAVGGVLSGQGVNTSETQQMIQKGVGNLLKNLGK